MSDKYQNFTAVLESMLDKYDKRLRPNFEGDPVEVYITMHISSISAISEVSMDYTIDFYLRQSWRDERLAYSGLDHDVTVGNEFLENIWVPDTFFPNEKRASVHTATTHNSFVRVTPNGEIFTSRRLTVTPGCPMELTMFPFDSQICSLELESYGYATDDIMYRWDLRDSKKKSVTVDAIRTPQFFLSNYTVTSREINMATGSYHRLYVFFVFERDVGFYIMQVYLPCIAVVCASLMAFWFPEELLGDRIALCFTAVLTMTVLMTTTNSNLPKISYVKAIDVYLITSFLIIFITLIESCFTAFLSLTAAKLARRKTTRGGNPQKSLHHQSSNSSKGSRRESRSKSEDGGNFGFSVETNNDVNCHEPLNADVKLNVSVTWWRRLLQRTGTFPLGDERQELGYIRAYMLDRFSRVFFTGFFLMFNIIYWSVYMPE